jgi:hypothetical protein
MHTRFLSVKCKTIEVKHVSQSCKKKQRCESSSFNVDPDPYPAFYFDSTIKLGHVNN